jgi:hypothetical protein
VRFTFNDGDDDDDLCLLVSSCNFVSTGEMWPLEFFDDDGMIIGPVDTKDEGHIL